MSFFPYDISLLIAEDESATREVLKISLSKYCKTIFVAKDGVEALEIFDREHPEILLSDLVMPNMDGFELIENVRKRSKNTHLVVMSAFFDYENITNLFSQGLFFVLPKPFDNKKIEVILGEIISNIINKKELIKSKQKYIEISKELRALNSELELRVECEVRKRREQELIASSKSKMAALGELLSMIAHQWRQPLTNITAIVGKLKIKKATGRLTEEKIDGALNDIEKHTIFLSNTIENFRNFYKPKTDIERLLICEVFDSIELILRGVLRQNGVEVIRDRECKLEIVSFKNDLEQLFLSCYSNSIDAFEINSIENPKIYIDTKFDNNYITIEFSDNAGGVDDEYIHRVFTPYFSTKEGKNGTGLGLYMVKNIIEKHLNGTINAHNCYNKSNQKGFMMEITIPRDKLKIES